MMRMKQKFTSYNDKNVLNYNSNHGANHSANHSTNNDTVQPIDPRTAATVAVYDRFSKEYCSRTFDESLQFLLNKFVEYLGTAGQTELTVVNSAASGKTGKNSRKTLRKNSRKNPEKTKHIREHLILDIGSGSGRDAMYLRDQGNEVICFDASLKMLLWAKKAVRSKNCSFVHGIMELLPFKENSFEGILMMGSLLHVPRKLSAKVLKTVYSIIKPDGILLLSMQEGQGEIFGQSGTIKEAGRFFVLYNAGELSALVEDVGFEVLHLSSEGRWINLFARKKDTTEK